MATNVYNYQQVLGMVMQMSEADRHRLVRDITPKSYELPCTFTDEEFATEVREAEESGYISAATFKEQMEVWRSEL